MDKQTTVSSRATVPERSAVLIPKVLITCNNISAVLNSTEEQPPRIQLRGTNGTRSFIIYLFLGAAAATAPGGHGGGAGGGAPREDAGDAEEGAGGVQEGACGCGDGDGDVISQEEYHATKKETAK